MFDQDLLRTFVAIVDTGSFAGAATAVGRTPSAVSMQIRRLEDATGRRLLNRSARGVQLTSSGEMLLMHAREILEAHEAAFDALMSERAPRALAIGLPDAFLESVLSPLLGELIDRFPDTNLRVQVEGSPGLVRRLDEAGLDLAVVTEHQLGGDDRGDVVHVEHGLWACAPDCPALTVSPLPIALHFEGSVFRRLAQEMLRRVARPYRIALTTNTERVIHEAVLSGAVVAPLPASRAHPSMRTLTPADGFPSFPPLLARMRLGRRRLPPAGEWLAERLRERGRALTA